LDDALGVGATPLDGGPLEEHMREHLKSVDRAKSGERGITRGLWGALPPCVWSGLLPGLVACLTGCGSPVYSRGTLWLESFDAGLDGVTQVDRPGRGSGGASGSGGTQGSGSGDGTGGDVFNPGPLPSGGSTADTGTGGLATAPVSSGGITVEMMGTGGVETGTVGTGGRGTGGAGTGGSGTGGAGTGGRGTGGAGTGGTGTGGAATGGASDGDSAAYNFESTSQGWAMAAGGGVFTTVARSTLQHFAGGASLAGQVSAVANKTYILEVAPPVPDVPPSAVVTFHLFIPSAALVSSVQPYVLEAGPSFRFTGTRVQAANFSRDAWTTVTVKVPSDAATILRMGVQFDSNGTWTGAVYVDSIDW